MYYILYEGLKIKSNEPVYYTVLNVQSTLYTLLWMPHRHIGEQWRHTYRCDMQWPNNGYLI